MRDVIEQLSRYAEAVGDRVEPVDAASVIGRRRRRALVVLTAVALLAVAVAAVALPDLDRGDEVIAGRGGEGARGAGSGGEVSLRAPRAGIYTYAVSSSGRDSEESFAVTSSPGSGEYVITTGDQHETFAATRNEFRLLSLRKQFNSARHPHYECEWNPPVVHMPSSLEIGASWRSESKCLPLRTPGQDPEGQLTREIDAHVEDQEEIHVPAGTFRAWRLRMKIVMSSTAEPQRNDLLGVMSATSATKEGLVWVSAELGPIPVREQWEVELAGSRWDMTRSLSSVEHE